MDLSQLHLSAHAKFKQQNLIKKEIYAPKHALTQKMTGRFKLKQNMLGPGFYVAVMQAK